MIDNTLTHLLLNLDRIADAVERMAMQQAEAITLARLQAVERKVEALADPGPAPAPAPEAPPAPPKTKAKAKAPAEPEPLPDPPAPEPEPPAAVTDLTHDTIRAIGKEIILREGPSRFKAVLKEHGADTVSALPIDALPAVREALIALLTQPQP